MRNKVTHEMIQSAIKNLQTGHTTVVQHRKAVPISFQSPLPFPVPTYLQGATSNIQLFSNPPSPSRLEVEAACPAIRLMAATGCESEEAWSLGIVNTAKFTLNPEDAAQVWSSAYPNYDSDEVSEKLAESKTPILALQLVNVLQHLTPTLVTLVVFALLMARHRVPSMRLKNMLQTKDNSKLSVLGNLIRQP